ncbi:unnamed protein product [Withania somnifera]
MEAVVDACLCEITRISEKVRARSLFLLKSQKKKSGEKVKASQKSSSLENKNDNITCEATVFLLMDRFAPC